jgi:hypothetical protein
LDKVSTLIPRLPSPARSQVDERHPSAQAETIVATAAAMSAKSHTAALSPPRRACKL